jgi:hypothetical protein
VKGYDKLVYERICSSHGHHIGSIQTGVAMSPDNHVLPDMEVFCINCGMDLEEIRTMKSRRPRKEKVNSDAPAA